MRVQQKITLIVIFASLIFIFLFAVFRYIDIKNYGRTEKRLIQERGILINQIIALKAQTLRTYTFDYSLWDEFVEFVKSRNLLWANKYLEQTLDTYGVDAVWVYNLSFEKIYSVSRLKEKSVLDSPLLQKDIQNIFSKEKTCHFFLPTVSGLMEIYGSTINPGADVERRQVGGYWFCGRLWNKEFLSELSYLTNSKEVILDIPSAKKKKFSINTYYSLSLSGWNNLPVAEVIFLWHSTATNFLREHSARNTYWFIGFTIFLSILIAMIINYEISRPLKLITLSLQKNDTRILAPLLRKNDEFKEIALTIKNSFEQQQKIMEEEEKYLKLFNSANDAIMLIEQDTFVDCNPKAVELFGCQSKEEVIGRKPSDFSPPYQPDGILSSQKALEKIQAAILGEPQIFPWVHRRNDGSIFYAEVSLNKITMQGQNLVQVILRDVTLHKEWEDKLKESEARFRAIFEKANDGILIVEVKSHKFLLANRKIAEMLGYTPEELSYLRVEDIHPQQSLPDILDNFKRLAMGEITLVADVPLLTKDKRVVFVDISASPLHLGDKQCLLGIFHDTSELRKAQQQLQQREALFRSIVSAVPVGLGIVQNRILKWLNKQGLELTGYTEEEVLNRNVRFLYASEQEYERVGKIFYEAITNKGAAQLESKIRRKDGQELDIFLTGVSINPNNLEQGVVFAMLDITEQKKAQQELESAYQKLQQTYAQLVQTAKMASLGTLAGGVAHEINNPLTGILNNVQLVKLLADQKKDFNLSDFKAVLDEVERSAQRCVSITQSLLNFSRSSKGKMQLIYIPEVINEIISIIGHELSLQNVELRVEIEDNIPLINADRQLLSQVIFDMINNARWAIKKRTDTQQGTINIRVKNDSQKGMVSLSISDTGIGIPKENLDRIFEPFFTTKEPGEGTGIGLSLAYNIMRSHNGFIEVESEVGKGTTFFLKFPVSA
ncbi:MAG: PAS domain S-box protein [Candidatus Omnitrophica bacterium]|nr:PAS domain S-box protein [Candidatus Omnitrophota bacterium]